MPLSRHLFVSTIPPPPSSTPLTYSLFVKSDFFIQNFLHREKILPLTPPDFRGNYHTFFIRRFSTSSSFILAIMDTSMPPNLARHL